MAEERTVLLVTKERGAEKTTKAQKTLEKQVENTNKDLDAQGDSLLDAAGDMRFFGVSINGVIGGFRTMTTVAKGSIFSLKSLKTALIATGIGAFVVVLGSLVAWFQSSEEGATKLNKVMTQVGVVVGNVTDIVANFGKALFSLFTGDRQSFKEAINDAIEGVKNFTEQTKKELEQGRKVANLEAQLLKDRREFAINQAATEAKVAELRLKARQEEEFSAQERMKFLEEANKLQNVLLDQELKIAKDELEIIKTRNSFSFSNTTNLDAEADAQANLSRVEAARFNKARQIQRELNRVINEINREAVRQEDAVISIQTERFENALRGEKIILDFKKRSAEQVIQLERKAAEDSIAFIARSGAFGKISSIALAYINTKEAITEALAVAPPPFNFGLAAAVGAFGLKQVRDIISTKIPGDGGYSGAGGISFSSTTTRSLPGSQSIARPELQNQPIRVIQPPVLVIDDLHKAEQQRSIQVRNAGI